MLPLCRYLPTYKTKRVLNIFVKPYFSSRLREVCPGLYRIEDAASSKAHELLLAAGQTAKAADRDRMVKEAVAIAKQIAGSLRLDVSVGLPCF